MRLGPRDEHLGWDKRTRGRNLHRLLANDRLLSQHGVAPLAVETCVEQGRPGSCYRAVDFERVGLTKGLPWGAKEPSRAQRSRPGFAEPERHRKQVFVKGLDPKGRQKLSEPVQRVLGAFAELGHEREDGHWSTREFQRSDLSDRRLRERLKSMGQAWDRKPGKCLPERVPRGSVHCDGQQLLGTEHARSGDRALHVLRLRRPGRGHGDGPPVDGAGDSATEWAELVSVHAGSSAGLCAQRRRGPSGLVAMASVEDGQAAPEATSRTSRALVDPGRRATRATGSPAGPHCPTRSLTLLRGRIASVPTPLATGSGQEPESRLRAHPANLKCTHPRLPSSPRRPPVS